MDVLSDYPFAFAPLIGVLASILFSAANLSKTWDEWLCNFIAAEIGAFGVTGIAFAIAEATKEPKVLSAALLVYAILSIAGASLARLLDLADHHAASVFSFPFKWLQSPLFTTIGLVCSPIVAIAKGVSFRRGCVFLNLGGSSQGALTLGAVVWALGGCFESDGRVKDDLAKHEAFHSRQVAAFNEIGFYLAYLIVGMPWGAAQGGVPMSTTSDGCGNPFEKTARTYNHQVTPKPAHKC